MRIFWLLSLCLIACNTSGKTVLEVEDGGTIQDIDGDGYVLEEDCDENNAAVNINAEELCDGIDNNCDGSVDEGVLTTFYLDYDEDGFGDDNRTLEACTLPVGYVPNGNDCDDSEPSVFPGNIEECDGLDNDCNGEIDEGTGGVVYEDVDGDGFGDPNASIDGCESTGNYVQNALDCDDSNVNINPNAIEICDEEDNNCDGETDEGVTQLYHVDSDGDGFGDPNAQAAACFPISGYVTDASDCDDSSAMVNPNQFEICDLLDNNCDGNTDEGVTITYYADLDQDGYGDPAETTNACSVPFAYTDNSDDCDDSEATLNPADADGDGYSTCDNDCDDSEPGINPNQFEVCDGLDNNCDGNTDEGVTITYYADLDQDGYGDPNQPSDSCSVPFAHIDNDRDCDDSIDTVNPDGVEVCNGLDDDCDGGTDAEFMTGSVYTDLYNCGSCGNDCTNQGYLNASTSCDTTLPTPACSFSCDSNYYDANLDSSDGCECLFISSVDSPFDGVDANCDGDDGDHNDAVHVSVAGSSSGTGTLGDPVDSIQVGIQLATSALKTYVLVESGTYTENVTLADGIIMLGSMDSSFHARNIATDPSIIMGDGSTPAVKGMNISLPTEVDGFQIWSPNSGGSGASAIALYLEDCTDALVFTENTIGANDASLGIDGNGGASGSDGGNGSDGQDSALTSCSSTRYGGAGGGNTCGSMSTSGGNGAQASCPYATLGGNSINGNTQPYGGNGSGPTPGLGGIGSCDSAMFSWYDCGTCILDTSCTGSGEAGTNGGNGSDGGGGNGASSSGYLQGTQWLTLSGTNGLDGTNGSGGGGGGAGSGGYSSGCGQNHGSGTGGGGGGGGCLGTGGQAGTGGGSSFGVVYKCTSSCSNLPIFIDNEITAGDGGNGGDGGDGGLGGFGGDAGLGGSVTQNAWCSGDGGAGGDGGNGGDGGGAGGGSGGNSFAVYAIGVTPDPLWVSLDNDLDAGLPGLGGRGGRGGSSANDGGDGASGDNGDQNW